MANIPAKVVNRLREEVPKFQKILSSAHDRDINEADTVVIITDMLNDVFGMDKYSEVTREFAIKGTYVDLAVKLEDKIEYLIEVKAIGLDLRENHLRQAVDYAAKEGVKWIVLTNGIEWEVHRVIVSGQVSNERIVKFNFLELSTRKDSDLDLLFMLCRRGVAKDLIDDYFERQQACNKFTIGALLSSEPVVSIVRRTLRQLTPGLKITTDEIEQSIINEVIKREIHFSEEGVEAQKKLKRALAKQARKKAANKKSSTDGDSIDEQIPASNS